MDTRKKKAVKDPELLKKQAIEGKELPSVKELSHRLGVHCFTHVETTPEIKGEGDVTCPVGVPLGRLFVLDQPVTPYLPLDQLDCMVIGILALSPGIKAAVEKAKETVNQE